jgi:hypothetical protein
MLTFSAFLREDTIDYGSYNLEHKFDHLNQLLFDNKVPKCPITWDNTLSKQSGITTYSHAGPNLIPGTLRIRI